MEASHILLHEHSQGAFHLDKFQNAIESFDSNDHKVALAELLKSKVDSPAYRISDDVDLYLQNGLEREHASQIYAATGRNKITSPQRCPGWLCCLLPCLNGTPKMKAYFSSQSESTSVVRSGKRFLIDSEGLVVGDVIQLFSGDCVPADCRIIEVTTKSEDVRFDASVLCGVVDHSQRMVAHGSENCTSDPIVESENICWAGSTVVSGACKCVVLAVGENLLWSRLIKSGRWISKR